MNSKRLRILTSWVLSVLLLAGGAAMPSFLHSHTGGDEAHHHHGHDPARAVHPERDLHSCDHHDDRVSNLLAPHVAHVHWAWFGFGFSLPVDSDDDQPDQPAPIWILEQARQSFAVDSSSARFVLPQPPDDALACLAIVVEKHVRGPCSQIAAPPLCAKASRERSGVQLI